MISNDYSPGDAHPPIGFAGMPDDPLNDPLETDTDHSSRLQQAAGSGADSENVILKETVATLGQQVQALQQEINDLQQTKTQLQQQVAIAQAEMGKVVQEGLKELESRKRELQLTVEQLERRQERIREEMRTTFAGTSQDLAIRVQSFKEYLVGSLQDLAMAADQLEFPQPMREPAIAPIEIPEANPAEAPTPKFAEQTFSEQTKKIRALLDQYRNRPDYYGTPWQLRR